MKMLTIIAVINALFFSLNASAITYSVIGPCSERSVYEGSFKTDLEDNLGKISLDIFEQENIPYIGSEVGMSSVLNTPTGMDAIEVISDTKMRAYGWCFSINGEIPDKLSNEVYFTKQSDHLMWFFAFSTYDQGLWTDYCVPSYQIKASQFCKKP